MKVRNNPFLLLTVLIILFVTNISAIAQMADSSKRNNPYSPSPVGKTNEKQIVATPSKNTPAEAVLIVQSQEIQNNDNLPTVAQRISKFPRSNESLILSLSEIYKVGIGDVLFVNLENSSQGSSYCTVRPDGKIEFPLAGEDLIVAGQTLGTIEKIIASGITLFPDPKVEVTVREYGSHKITVSGMVENPGAKNLQREAMPLCAIRSEASVNPRATKAIVKRAPLLKLEVYDLHDSATDSVMIYPGNSIEFTSDQQADLGSYYISGEINLSGQKTLNTGITLYQAVIASGGAKGEPKRATIRRKNEKGLFENTEYDLRSIKNGKKADPVLIAGDVIEIRK